MFPLLLSLLEALVRQIQQFDGLLVIPDAILPVGIFLLRMIDISISTLRTFAVARGSRAAAWLLGFVQALFFVSAVSAVLTRIRNPLNLVAFAAGMATGNVLGITIEGLLAPGHSLMRIYSPGHGEALTRHLRELGFGATVLPGKGQDGMVSMILCFLPRRKVRSTKDQIIARDPEAYVSVENVRQLGGGWRA
jgi:uncharacterized protein YebE (UPF0316 family)